MWLSDFHRLGCLPAWWLCSWWAGAVTAGAIRWQQTIGPRPVPRLRTPLLAENVQRLKLDPKAIAASRLRTPLHVVER